MNACNPRLIPHVVSPPLEAEKLLTHVLLSVTPLRSPLLGLSLLGSMAAYIALASKFCRAVQCKEWMESGLDVYSLAAQNVRRNMTPKTGRPRTPVEMVQGLGRSCVNGQ